MSSSIIEAVNMVIVMQCLIVAFILVSVKNKNHDSNKFLASFLLIIALQFAGKLAIELNFYSATLVSFNCFYGFLYGPLLYFYTNTLIFKEYRYKRINLLHLIPVSAVIVLFFLDRNYCQELTPLIYVSVSLYMLYSIKLLNTYRKIFIQTQSSTKVLEMVWLQWSIILIGLTLILEGLIQFFNNRGITHIEVTLHLTILVIINILLYKSLKQPQLFLGLSYSDKSLTEPYFENQKTDTDKEDLKLLEDYILTTKAFQQSELTIYQLSKETKLTIQRISFLINYYKHENFLSFINTHRIAFARSLMDSTTNDSQYLEIMIKSGFNSMTAFKRALKQTSITVKKD